MTYEQLEAAIRAVLPNADFGRDYFGQIVIYSGVRRGSGPELETWEGE